MAKKMPLIGREHIIRIFPQIEYAAQCPHDGANLRIIKPVIPGMRCLAECECTMCGSQYYTDLPVGQALWSPMMVNRKSGETYDIRQIQASRQKDASRFTISSEWFRQPLQEGFFNPVKEEIIPIVETFYCSERIVILNCLDFLYGHSLLKLLNAQRYLEHTPEFGCCVLVPSQLRHLVPDGVAEIWEFPIHIRDGWKWYVSLQTWMDCKLSQYQECFLSPAYSHPGHHIYDLSRFVKNLPDVSETLIGRQPVIMFCYREDRLWGSSLEEQQRNIRQLFQQLTDIFPDMVFILTGFGEKKPFLSSYEHVIDMRMDRFDVEQDRAWMAYMSMADCVVGIHGSNMLLPSGLAKATVELVPRSRLGNTVQDFLFQTTRQEARDALLFYRLLYGSETLSDIRPSMVVEAIAVVLSYAVLNSRWFRCEEQETLEFTEWQTLCQQAVFRQAITHLCSKPKASWFQNVKAYITEIVRRKKV